MKNKILFFIVGIMGISCHVTYSLSDDAVVDSIKAHSNLTQADVDRWKLLWMGGLAEPAAAMTSLYGMYKAYNASSAITPSKEALEANVFKSQIYGLIAGGYRPSETMQNFITSGWTWAGASVAGAGIVAYKILYPRVQAGLLEKIKDYVTLCERLAVTQSGYQSEHQFRNALNQPGNTVWVVSSPVAQQEGFNNVIGQANIALLLIEQLAPSLPEDKLQEVATLRQKVITFKNNAQHNAQFIQGDLQHEQQVRAQQRTEYGKDLDIQRREVAISGRQIKNVTRQWDLLKDIGKTAKEYGPSILFGVGTVFGISKLTELASKLMPAKK